MKEKKMLLGVMLMLALGGMGFEAKELIQRLSQRGGAEQSEHNLLDEGSHELAKLFQRVCQKGTMAGAADQALAGRRKKVLTSKLPAGKVNAAGVIWGKAKKGEPYYRDSVASSDYYRGYPEK